MMLKPHPEHVDLLILGAGWTSTFLIPQLEREKVSYAATTTDGRDGTIPFRFNPESDDASQFRRLPTALTVVISFPLKGQGPSRRLVELYGQAHAGTRPHFIQLGATSIWNAAGWQDEKAPYDTANERAVAEDELRDAAGGAVLNLAGLYGGARQPRTWVDRVIKSKPDLQAKGALHLIHGEDVARAITALHRNFTPGKRWLLCDLHIYDWWDLIEDWASDVVREAAARPDQASEADVAKQTQFLRWVGELMEEEGVRALPRDASLLGRVLDGRGFWKAMGIMPARGRVR